VTTRFDRDTAVAPVPGEEGVFGTHIDPGWWVVSGPNGGYLAALVVRALERAVGDPERVPRSLTLHYTLPPTAGPARIETRIERAGRSLTTLSARLSQEGQLVALALAAFSKPRRGGIELEQAPMPEVLPPHRAQPFERRIEIHDRYEQRWALGGPPFSGSERALCGGWIRLPEPRLLDAALAAAYTDAFPPALFSVLREGQATRGMPTVDLDIHFRSRLPRPGATPEDWTLAVFRTRVAREGFLEEDGELWSADGRLLVQSRQLALAR
jgi:acyl-CoA thioesterase